MDIIAKAKHHKELEAAAMLPSVADGESIKDPVWALRPRNDGNWRAYKDGAYWGTTGCKSWEDAREWLELLLKQQEAALKGMFDVRREPVWEAIEDRRKTVDRRKLKGAKVIKSTLKALKPFIEGQQLRHLTDDRVAGIVEEMVEAEYSREYGVNAIRFLRTAVRQHTKKKFGSPFVPFDAPASSKGRETVVTKTQRDRVKRWGLGTETYDPKTGRWTPQAGLTDADRRDRRIGYRELSLGLIFGSRPGAYHKLSWEQHDEGGWLDLDGGTFHRVPPGKSTPGNKVAPPVPIPVEVLPELRRWKEEDGDCPWVFSTIKGGPMSQGHQQKIFTRAMKAVGITGVTGHVLRHTCITRMIEQGTSAPSISAVCGVSIAMLYRRYGHFENRAVQMLALGVMGQMMQ